ncbi:sensor histidine kinase [Mucilaginibacter gilvus]|uniref:histidine kinase n=1 Tax=Mucilaginibacter gilvus TaxID=2305909 RepID=A0A3S3UX68_9SPHI|nr:HAMP domain-containing sensor histidine kinase [Mucilaginibacter gilvus]RWY50293.1 HAMP domain-containing histidine kinase [Mucilaginibacter gilvus]
MKKKLYIVLFLTTILLAGIIALQLYWTFTAYKLNKEKFDGDINIAMQRALHSCKKDYFDSIRVVMIKRLSEPHTHIKIDTARNRQGMFIWISNRYLRSNEPYQTTIPVFNHYRQQINHQATVPEVITEMSFYVPSMLDQVTLVLGMEDVSSNWKKVEAYVKAHSEIPRDSIFAQTNIVQRGTYGYPPNYRQADSIKLHRYFKEAMRKLHPKNRRSGDFSMVWSDKPIPANDFDPHHVEQLRYSETEQFTYRYHGFLFLQHTDKNALYVRVVYDRAQVGILSEMVLILCLSGFLIVFTKFCLFYIILTIVKQKKLTELKDDFINNMTHELKTPIATITVAIEGLQKFNGLNDPEKTQRYLQTSRNELSRLDGLVTKVLNIAAFESKKIVLAKERIAIDELMNELIEAEKQKTAKEVSISYINSDGIKEIEADKMHLRNIMLNLVDNAIKYATEPVDIKISLTRHNKYAVFSIKDNGMGIPARHIKHIFDKFHRVPAGNVHNVKGTGLGLNYVKYIAEAHGGKVAVTSKMNKGSEFTVSIPIKNG